MITFDDCEIDTYALFRCSYIGGSYVILLSEIHKHKDYDIILHKVKRIYESKNCDNFFIINQSYEVPDIDGRKNIIYINNLKLNEDIPFEFSEFKEKYLEYFL